MLVQVINNDIGPGAKISKISYHQLTSVLYVKVISLTSMHKMEVKIQKGNQLI